MTQSISQLKLRTFLLISPHLMLTLEFSPSEAGCTFSNWQVAALDGCNSDHWFPDQTVEMLSNEETRGTSGSSKQGDLTGWPGNCQIQPHCWCFPDMKLKVWHCALVDNISEPVCQNRRIQQLDHSVRCCWWAAATGVVQEVDGALLVSRECSTAGVISAFLSALQPSLTYFVPSSLWLLWLILSLRNKYTHLP